MTRIHAWLWICAAFFLGLVMGSVGLLFLLIILGSMTDYAQ